MKTLLLLIVSISIAFTASFDCSIVKKDRSGISDFYDLEMMICSDAELSYLDEQVASAYFKVKNSLPQKEATEILNNQRKWLKNETRTCNYPLPQEKSLDCLIDLFEKRYQFFHNKYPSIVEPYKKLCELKYQDTGKEICKLIENDFKQSIIDVGVRKFALFSDITYKSAQLFPYKQNQVAVSRYGFLHINTQLPLTLNNKTVLFLDDLGSKIPSKHQTWIVDTNKLQKLLSIEPKEKNKYALSDELQNLLNKSLLVNEYNHVPVFYQHEFGDILIDINCDKDIRIGDDSYCEHIDYINILKIDDSNKINELCHIKDLEQDSTLLKLERQFIQEKQYKKRVEIIRQILAQPNQKGKDKVIEQIFTESDSRLHIIPFESSRWNDWGMTYHQQLTLLLKLAALGKTQEIKEKAYDELDYKFYNNGSDGCFELPTIKENVSKSVLMTESEKSKVLIYLDDTILLRCKEYGYLK